MARDIKADIVFSYPDTAGYWKTLELSKYQAEYIQGQLEFALGKLNEKHAAIRNGDTPAAYAE